MEDGGFFQGPWNHSKEELTQLTRKKMSLAGYWLFLIPLPICQCSHGFLSAGFFSSAPNPLGFGRAGFSSRHQIRAGGMTHPEKLRLVPRATLLIPTCHLGTEKQESAPASHPTAFWMGVSSGRRPHLQGVALNSSTHSLASSFSAFLRVHICLIIPAARQASLSTLGLPWWQPSAKGKGTACWHA